MWDVWSCTVVSFVEYNTVLAKRLCQAEGEEEEEEGRVWREEDTRNWDLEFSRQLGIQHYRMCIYCLNERKQVLGYLVMRIMCTITM
ncbi:unnamed protein product [Sphagnum troendelagicum]|uniref:Uncharacterized protein n=1 Tax=Sphagnum troendelagicum TaxID=128251 RepID=A0ABP0UVB8_9BRYO